MDGVEAKNIETTNSGDPCEPGRDFGSWNLAHK
jgi:hypothetical protein